VTDEVSFVQYLRLAERPDILIYTPRDGSTDSPTELPAPSESSFGSSLVGSNASTRGNAHKTMTEGVKWRDDQQCVVTGEMYQKGARNLANAHIFPVNEKWSTGPIRLEAGVSNAYNVSNGLLLANIWHEEFDNGNWCMDKDCIIHLADILKDRKDFSSFAGKPIRRPSTVAKSDSFPTPLLLGARFQLWKEGRVSKGNRATTETKRMCCVCGRGRVKNNCECGLPLHVKCTKVHQEDCDGGSAASDMANVSDTEKGTQGDGGGEKGGANAGGEKGNGEKRYGEGARDGGGFE
jgi:hypothetical protein